MSRTIPLIAMLAAGLTAPTATAELKTWDGKHSIAAIDVTLVYFVPQGRPPLPDWRERLDYYQRRLEQFHAREFQGQSQLTAHVHPQPFLSELDAAQLRQGDGDAIFYRTLREVDRRLNFAQGDRAAFPILLVFSDINWRPLDDFFRLSPGAGGPSFEGNQNEGEHFPGAKSGGARATYLSREGKGWGLVSADGWRVPYRGSDCVVYHEGCGHTVGLPHPEPSDGSVMSQGQYRGWISESWLDREQKGRLGWEPPPTDPDLTHDLFSKFRALPVPRVPKPDEPVELQLDWPADAQVASVRVRIQTELFGPWLERPVDAKGAALEKVSLGSFDRPTPVSYRVDAELADGQTVELRGYFQVRTKKNQPVIPPFPLVELQRSASEEVLQPLPALDTEIDLLAQINPERDGVQGTWTLTEGILESPKMFGARIEAPVEVPAEYELTAIVEPLDEPNGLILGQLLDAHRFQLLFNYTPAEISLSALENVDGENVDDNSTRREGALFRRGRLSEICCEVRRSGVRATVDGRVIVDWRGDPARLSLSDYWKTPHEDRLFLGAYDCRYRFHRVTLRPLIPQPPPPQ